LDKFPVLPIIQSSLFCIGPLKVKYELIFEQA
jgi:hypothetical protein